MNKSKCRDCGLVDVAGESYCRRCASPLYETERNARKESGQTGMRTIPLLRVAGLAIAAYAAYAYFGQDPADPTPLNAVNRQISQPQPRPTLSLRTEHEQRQTAAYKIAIQNSSGIAESQKRLEETKKLMPSEPTKPQR